MAQERLEHRPDGLVRKVLGDEEGWGSHGNGADEVA
jgi:hypothetical protein